MPFFGCFLFCPILCWFPVFLDLGRGKERKQLKILFQQKQKVSNTLILSFVYIDNITTFSASLTLQVCVCVCHSFCLWVMNGLELISFSSGFVFVWHVKCWNVSDRWINMLVSLSFLGECYEVESIAKQERWGE